jgi:hypothetical protein
MSRKSKRTKGILVEPGHANRVGSVQILASAHAVVVLMSLPPTSGQSIGLSHAFYRSLEIIPKFSAGWNMLGDVLQTQFQSFDLLQDSRTYRIPDRLALSLAFPDTRQINPV